MYERILLCYLRADLDVAGDCTAAVADVTECRQMSDRRAILRRCRHRIKRHSVVMDCRPQTSAAGDHP